MRRRRSRTKAVVCSPHIPSDLLHFRVGAAETRGTVRQISDPPLLQDRAAVFGATHTDRERERITATSPTISSDSPPADGMNQLENRGSKNKKSMCAILKGAIFKGEC